MNTTTLKALPEDVKNLILSELVDVTSTDMEKKYNLRSWSGNPFETFLKDANNLEELQGLLKENAEYLQNVKSSLNPQMTLYSRYNALKLFIARISKIATPFFKEMHERGLQVLTKNVSFNVTINPAAREGQAASKRIRVKFGHDKTRDAYGVFISNSSNDIIGFKRINLMDPSSSFLKTCNELLGEIAAKGDTMSVLVSSAMYQVNFINSFLRSPFNPFFNPANDSQVNVDTLQKYIQDYQTNGGADLVQLSNNISISPEIEKGQVDALVNKAGAELDPVTFAALCDVHYKAHGLKQYVDEVRSQSKAGGIPRFMSSHHLFMLLAAFYIRLVRKNAASRPDKETLDSLAKDMFPAARDYITNLSIYTDLVYLREGAEIDVKKECDQIQGAISREYFSWEPGVGVSPDTFVKNTVQAISDIIKLQEKLQRFEELKAQRRRGNAGAAHGGGKSRHKKLPHKK